MRLELVVVFLASIYSSEAFTCPGVYHKIGDGCYTFTEENLSWVNASLICSYAGGYLANIESATEQNDLLVYRQGIVSSWKYWWIGANDIVGEGEWRWAPSGRTVDFEIWGSGYPSTSTSYYARDCASWYNDGNYWINEECTIPTSNGILCEADPVGIVG